MSRGTPGSTRPQSETDGPDPVYCLGEGLYELRSFLAKYKRFKGGFEDWQIVSAVASSIYSMLKSGRGCPDVKKMVIEAVAGELEKAGIDRRAVYRAYLHGVSEDVVSILYEIFPHLVSLSPTVDYQPQGRGGGAPSVAAPYGIARVEVAEGSRAKAGRAAYRSSSARGWGRKLKRALSAVLAVFIVIGFIALIFSAASWRAKLLAYPQQTVANVINTTTTVTTVTTTVTQQTVANVTPMWVQQFINDINLARIAQGDEPLQYCSALSQFAQLRFTTMEKEPDISHYGFDRDYTLFFGGGVEVGEVVFPISPGETPSQFADEIREYAPLHWRLLIDPNLTYYGWYGNVMEQPTCVFYQGEAPPMIEIPGPGINITQYLLSNGCTSVTMEPTYVLVIDEADLCPGAGS